MMAPSPCLGSPHLIRPLRQRQVVLDDALFDKMWAKVDPAGVGELDYGTFCARVMKSNGTDSTSGGLSSGEQVATLAPKVLQRMVRESAKDLRSAFGHLDEDGTGAVATAKLRAALVRYNIELNDKQWKDLIQKIDLNDDGEISYMEFLNYFRKTEIQAERAEAVGVVSGMPVYKAVQLIRDKIMQRLEGGPAGLRRAFQYFDNDGVPPPPSPRATAV